MVGYRKTRADPLLISALAEGRRVADAAEAARVSERTVYRRLEDPEFRQAIRQQQEDARERTRRNLQLWDTGQRMLLAVMAQTVTLIQNGTLTVDQRLRLQADLLKGFGPKDEPAPLEDPAEELAERTLEDVFEIPEGTPQAHVLEMVRRTAVYLEPGGVPAAVRERREEEERQRRVEAAERFRHVEEPARLAVVPEERAPSGHPVASRYGHGLVPARGTPPALRRDPDLNGRRRP
jgi:hypothetical protein